MPNSNNSSKNNTIVTPPALKIAEKIYYYYRNTPFGGNYSGLYPSTMAFVSNYYGGLSFIPHTDYTATHMPWIEADGNTGYTYSIKKVEVDSEGFHHVVPEDDRIAFFTVKDGTMPLFEEAFTDDKFKKNKTCCIYYNSLGYPTVAVSTSGKKYLSDAIETKVFSLSRHGNKYPPRRLLVALQGAGGGGAGNYKVDNKYYPGGGGGAGGFALVALNLDILKMTPESLGLPRNATPLISGNNTGGSNTGGSSTTGGGSRVLVQRKEIIQRSGGGGGGGSNTPIYIPDTTPILKDEELTSGEYVSFKILGASGGEGGEHAGYGSDGDSIKVYLSSNTRHVVTTGDKLMLTIKGGYGGWIWNNRDKEAKGGNPGDYSINFSEAGGQPLFWIIPRLSGTTTWNTEDTTKAVTTGKGCSVKQDRAGGLIWSTPTEGNSPSCTYTCYEQKVIVGENSKGVLTFGNFKGDGKNNTSSTRVDDGGGGGASAFANGFEGGDGGDDAYMVFKGAGYGSTGIGGGFGSDVWGPGAGGGGAAHVVYDGYRSAGRSGGDGGPAGIRIYY